MSVLRPGVHAASFGPLSILGLMYGPVLYGLALLFMSEYTRSSPGPQRTSYFLMAAGFALNGLFDGMTGASNVVALLASGGPHAWLPWGWGVALLPALSLLPALASLALMGAHHFNRRAAVERQLESR